MQPFLAPCVLPSLSGQNSGLCTGCCAEQALVTSPTYVTILCHPCYQYFHFYTYLNIIWLCTCHFLVSTNLYQFVTCLVRSRCQVRHLWCLQNGRGSQVHKHQWKLFEYMRKQSKYHAMLPCKPLLLHSLALGIGRPTCKCGKVLLQSDAKSLSKTKVDQLQISANATLSTSSCYPNTSTHLKLQDPGRVAQLR